MVSLGYVVSSTPAWATECSRVSKRSDDNQKVRQWLKIIKNSQQAGVGEHWALRFRPPQKAVVWIGEVGDPRATGTDLELAEFLSFDRKLSDLEQHGR